MIDDLRITKLQTRLATIESMLEKQVWSPEETIHYRNKEFLEIQRQLVEVYIQIMEISIKLEAIEELFGNDFSVWSPAKKRKYGNEEGVSLQNLIKEKEQLIKEKKHLLKKKEQLEEHVLKREEQLLKNEELRLQLKLQETVNSQAIELPLKRRRSTASSGSRTGNGAELNQSSFRARILNRDRNGCALTGINENECDACHIVPWAYFQKNDLVGKKVFDAALPYSCNNPEHRIMDVRNGILMSRPLHASFDKFEFTIFKTENGYVIKTLDQHELPEEKSVADKELKGSLFSYNGTEIHFDPEKKNEWPGSVFLKFHNECFHENRETLKAEMEAQDYDEYDYEADDYDEYYYEGYDYEEEDYDKERAESIAKVEKWLSVTDDPEIPAFVE